jgi:hypothetical protein
MCFGYYHCFYYRSTARLVKSSRQAYVGDMTNKRLYVVRPAINLIFIHASLGKMGLSILMAHFILSCAGGYVNCARSS